MIARSLVPEAEDQIVAALSPRLREALNGYVQALDAASPPLAPSTRRVYQSRVTGYLSWLHERGNAAAALRDPAARNTAVTEYQRWLRDEQQRAVSAVNAVLTAVDDFYRRLGLGAAVITRDVVTPNPSAGLPAQALRAVNAALGGEGMSAEEAARERAVVDLMRFAGLSGAEIAALDVTDVRLPDAETAEAAARIHIGGGGRDLPLHPDLLASLRVWLTARANWPGAEGSPALFVNRTGGRLSARFVTMIVQQLGERAGVELGPAVLRATFAERLAAADVAPAAVAALTGRRVPDRREPPPFPQLRDAVLKL